MRYMMTLQKKARAFQKALLTSLRLQVLVPLPKVQVFK